MAARRRHSGRRHSGRFGALRKVLSVVVIFGCLIAALTFFFRVNEIVVTGTRRYTEEQVREATGVKMGDNLYLMNKNQVVQNIRKALPYVEEIHPRRRLPDTLIIEIQECGEPMAVVQDGSAWLVSSKGRIVEQKSAAAAARYGVIDGCTLLAPSVGTPIVLDTETERHQESLLALIAALEAAGMLPDTQTIHLGDPEKLTMDYGGRFTVEMPYGADYALKVKALRLTIENEKIQDNMTGTIDLTRENEVQFRQERS